MDQSMLVIGILATLVAYLVWDTYYEGEVEKVRSRVDGNDYTVRVMPDKQEAADLLAEIRERLEKLVAYVAKKAPEDPRTQNIVRNFRPERISEGPENKKYTSYSVNKGEKIVFCLRSKDAQKRLVDINTMMYVAVHELAHVGTSSVGHNEEFWANMRWLLEMAVDIGVYEQVDYDTSPVQYCGTTISSTVLK